MDTEQAREYSHDPVGLPGPEVRYQFLTVGPYPGPFLRIMPGQHLAVSIVVLRKLALSTVCQCILSPKFQFDHLQKLLACPGGTHRGIAPGGNAVVGMLPVNGRRAGKGGEAGPGEAHGQSPSPVLCFFPGRIPAEGPDEVGSIQRSSGERCLQVRSGSDPAQIPVFRSVCPAGALFPSGQQRIAASGPCRGNLFRDGFCQELVIGIQKLNECAAGPGQSQIPCRTGGEVWISSVDPSSTTITSTE